jgi:hypothetical protein
MEESSWISRKRRKNKPVIAEDEPHMPVLEDLKIDVGGFEDLKMSLDPGSGNDMYSLRSPDTMLSPATVATAETKETVLTLKPPQKPLMQKLNQYSPVKDQKMTCKSRINGAGEDHSLNCGTVPQAMELEDTSNNLGKGDAMDIDIEPPTAQPQPEIRKGPKWQVKTDNLVRPVSSGRANALAANVSQTIAAINKNNFHATSKWSANVDTMASARPSMESSRSKMTSQTNYTDKVDSVLGSNASITTSHGATRRPLGDTARTNTNTNRHTITDVDKLVNSPAEQENKRQSFPPVAVRRQSLVNMHSAQQERPKSPTGSIASTATGAPRARRQSGTNVSSRLSWIQDLENGGKKGPGQEYMMNKLSGGVAEKLRRFESQNSQPAGSASRSQSATRSTSATRRGSEAYGIEPGPKRLSRAVTADDDFRKKLEEQFQRKQKRDDEREKKKRNRASLPVHAGRSTPQQIIDYVELNDKDREAEINEMMKDGKGGENARKLDLQAKAALSSQVKATPRQANAVFQNATAALKSTTNLLDMSSPPIGSSAQNSKSTPSLQRTMSVQARARKVSPSLAKPPRPVSYAPPVSAPMDDDEYDPFNYAVYPSRSSIYSNPPEAPAMTPEVESREEEVFEEIGGVEGSTATLVDPEPEPELELEPVGEKERAEAEDEVEASVKPAATVESKSEIPVSSVEPKEAPKPTSGWAARFQSQPAALPLRIHGNPSKPAAVQASAITSAPREEEDTAESSEELVAREAVPASPTLVNISRPSSKRTTPVKEKFVDVEAPKVVEEPRPATPKKSTPSELMLAGGSVKIASPCSSPKKASGHEFNAAALPRLGTA